MIICLHHRSKSSNCRCQYRGLVLYLDGYLSRGCHTPVIRTPDNSRFAMSESKVKSRMTKRSLLWVFMHTGLVIILAINLLTGLRTATFSHPWLLHLSALLPQGVMQEIHLRLGFALVGLFCVYLCYRIFFRQDDAVLRYSKGSDIYHSLVKWLGYCGLLGLMLSGVSLYFNLFPSSVLVSLHVICAFLLVIYIPLHAGVYIAQYGMGAFKQISYFSRQSLRNNMVFSGAGLLMVIAVSFFARSLGYEPLQLVKIPADTVIDIDGSADEAAWKSANDLHVFTFDGANFRDGQTQISIKAMENGTEVFFFLRWEDPSPSVSYLPLVKTEQGWQVQQSGFDHFDETEHYEDKLAMIFANNCDFGAAGTAHMGPKPLAGKPANWHGKGYHYTDDNSLVDLWQWKAVRTNDMYLADDNFIAGPDIERPGSRRYTAGYQQDGKESGAYVMNWAWYQKSGSVVPKRLPKNPDDLLPYQPQAHPENNSELSWVIPWFAYEPYTPERDTFPPGTVMPSVIYSSNRFEGDRADVRARAQWKEGYWSLELVRKLSTGSSKDIALTEGVCLWVAAFDHSQIAHTRHVRPLKLHFGE